MQVPLVLAIALALAALAGVAAAFVTASSRRADREKAARELSRLEGELTGVRDSACAAEAERDSLAARLVF